MEKKARVTLHLFGTVVLVIAVAIILFTIIPIFEKPLPKDKTAITKDSATWMKRLNDNLYLNELTIPGSHDAGTNYVQLSFFSKCQGNSIYQQLNDGYRYLDIRLGISTNNDKKELNLMHGFTYCRNSLNYFSKKLTFEDIAIQCEKFLIENPSETILFVVKQEHGNESVQEFQNLLSESIGPHSRYWLLTDTIPTLKEARGKIVLFRRYNDEAQLGIKSGIGFNWVNQDGHVDTTKSAAINENLSCTIFVQDRYEYNAKDKWNAFTADIGKIPHTRGTGICYLNFLSTKGTLPYGHPYKYARRLNKKLYNTDLQGFLGWVIVDFGSAELAKKIYSRNF